MSPCQTALVRHGARMMCTFLCEMRMRRSQALEEETKDTYLQGIGVKQDGNDGGDIETGK